MNIDTTKTTQTTEPAIGFIPCYRLPFLSLFHADCMEIMKQYPDKYFDLAIVDPPYGLERFKANDGGNSKKITTFGDKYKNWNNIKPEPIVTGKQRKKIGRAHV